MDERSLTEIYHGLQDAKTEPIETGLGIVSDDAWSVKVKSQHLSTEGLFFYAFLLNFHRPFPLLKPGFLQALIPPRSQFCIIAGGN